MDFRASASSKFSVLERIKTQAVRNQITGCIEMLKKPYCAAGYTQIRVEGRLHVTHRYVYELLVGPIPPRHQIDHLCSNPKCINPKHLELVSPSENSQRSFERRRRRGGVQRKLDQQTVDAIRMRYAAGGVTQQELAKEYGVTHTTICGVINRWRWQGPRRQKADVDEKTLCEIMELREKQMLGYRVIGLRYGFTEGQTRGLIQRELAKRNRSVVI